MFISDDQKRSIEKHSGRPYEEVAAEARKNLEELNFSQRNIEFIIWDNIWGALDKNTLASAKRIYDQCGEKTAVVFLTTD